MGCKISMVTEMDAGAFCLRNMTGFDNGLYIKKQSEQISRRISDFGGKLYLEFGGKLFDDLHASRVLPGFQPDSKLKMLRALAADAEIVIAIGAADIESGRMRSDIGITYTGDVLRLTEAFRGLGLYVGSVVITQYAAQPAAAAFKARLESLGLKVFCHYTIDNYPYDLASVVGERGFGLNDDITTSRPLVVVTAPGPGSGKMAVCMSQLYHEHRRGVRAGYAKFETFPIWNLPLGHPVNLAYEAATADLGDVNMIDPYHLEAYGKTAVNYNRDVESFPVLDAMLTRISGKSPYRSPTDMGVNMAGYCICDNAAVELAAQQEIIRRYVAAVCDRKRGKPCAEQEVNKLEFLIRKAGVTPDGRAVVGAALARSRDTGSQPAVAIGLADGRLVTGKTSELLGAASAALLNAVKAEAAIGREVKLIPPEVIEPIRRLKVEVLGNRNPRLHSDETLVALSIGAAQNGPARAAFEALGRLRGCEAHSSVLLSQVDEDVFRKLGINLTCEPVYGGGRLFHK